MNAGANANARNGDDQTSSDFVIDKKVRIFSEYWRCVNGYNGITHFFRNAAQQESEAKNAAEDSEHWNS
jgi:hypothetical protein